MVCGNISSIFLLLAIKWCWKTDRKLRFPWIQGKHRRCVVKGALKSLLVAALPGNKRSYTLDTKSWDQQITCVLSAKQKDGSSHATIHYIRTLTESKHKRTTVYQAYLEALRNVVLLCPYLLETPESIRTDHGGLERNLLVTESIRSLLQ